MNILLVDGYNIIGAWPELRELKERDLAAARDRLIEHNGRISSLYGEPSNYSF